MAEKTSIDSVGPITGQLKTELSSLEKIQISAIRNLGGSPSSKAGVINGSIANSLTNINNTQKSMMEIGSNLAAKLERQGAFSKGVEKTVTSAVTSTVSDRIPLPQRFPKNPVDMSKKGNRVPDITPKNPYQRINASKERIVGRADFPYGGLMFPPDLDKNAASYIELEFFAYDRSAPFEGGKISQSTKVQLPIPENFTINHEIKYQERDTGILGDLMQTDAARNAMSTLGQTGSISQAASAAGEAIASVSTADAAKSVEAVAKRAAFAALNSADEVVGGLAGRIAGEIPNPHPTVFFKGLELRQFTWTWKLVPRSADEAASLKQIIMEIKRLVLPEKDGSFLKYPHLLKPKVLPDATLYGNFMKSAIKTFSVNYTAEGTSAFFIDGTPVSVNLILTFQEMENMTAGDV